MKDHLHHSFFIIVFQLYLHNFSEKCPFRYSEKKTNPLNNAIITIRGRKWGKKKSSSLGFFFEKKPYTHKGERKKF